MGLERFGAWRWARAVAGSVRRLTLALAVVAAIAAVSSDSAAAESDDVLALKRAAPSISSHVLELALQAASCAERKHERDPRYLAVIDYSLPSTARRFWLFDRRTGQLIDEELVAHGQNSGEDLATRFSNSPGSHQSSLGLFVASETYIGRHGYSLRLDGLEPGFNDHARERAIVVHGADYVSESFIRARHRLGRSHGCPALPVRSARRIIDRLAAGAFLFAYYPDNNWLARSSYLTACESDARPRLAHAAPASRAR